MNSTTTYLKIDDTMAVTNIQTPPNMTIKRHPYKSVSIPIIMAEKINK